MGLYITIEGPEATGKSTQVKLLSAALKEGFPDLDILLTKEPGSPHNTVCTQIRQILLDPTNVIMDTAALFLFLADRSQHIETVIKPHLDKGGVVISDRSSLSTVVYHAAKMLAEGREEKNEYFYEMLDFAQQIQPDLSFVATADFKWSKKQLKARPGLDRIESFGEDFHRHIHNLFEEIAALHIPMSNNLIFGIRVRMQHFPKRIVALPKASGVSADKICEEMCSYVRKELL